MAASEYFNPILKANEALDGNRMLLLNVPSHIRYTDYVHYPETDVIEVL
jgi:hypothetical protein